MTDIKVLFENSQFICLQVCICSNASVWGYTRVCTISKSFWIEIIQIQANVTSIPMQQSRLHIWSYYGEGFRIKMLTRTYSNTELSFWSPQMRISVMERMVSTRRFRLWSVTVVFLVRTWYMYLRDEWVVYAGNNVVNAHLSFNLSICTNFSLNLTAARQAAVI